MGVQIVEDVDLIRHAYAAPEHQRTGFGSTLLTGLYTRLDYAVLIGTWATAHWAIDFYQHHEFKLASQSQKSALLTRHRSTPVRQIETSLVLAHARWNLSK